MARRSKVVFCLLLAFLYVVVNICPLRAEALPDVMSGSTTLADNIMTYYALSGSAVANTDWINTLYNSYGSSFGTIEELANEGYLVLNDEGFWEPVEALGEMIEQAPAYSSLGLNEMFNVSAEEVAAGGGLAVASGGSILAGSLGGVASTGVVPLLGGVTAAYWGGIGIGTLIAHMTGLYGEKIDQGRPITSEDINTIGSSNRFVEVNSSYKSITASNLPLMYCCYKSGNSYTGFLYIKGVIGETNTYRNITLQNSGYISRDVESSFTGSQSNKGIYSIGKTYPISSYIPGERFYPYVMFNDATEMNNYMDGVKNGENEFPKAKSPDMIGENGNMEGSYDSETGKYVVPDMKPQIDTGTQAGKPLSMQDWMNFANGVQNNNSNTSPSGSSDNQSLFDNILDLIRTVIPENVPNPNPNPNPDPYIPPVVNPVPDPSYPDPVPDQQITENPQESENPQQTEDPIDTGKPWRLPDLRNKFPFCIPWDIGKIFTKLKVNERQAPHISWRFNPPNTPIDYTFNLDLEDFEEAAALLRTLELMGFIVGLAFVTRYLIGAN